jgi:hypothetical protein
MRTPQTRSLQSKATSRIGGQVEVAERKRKPAGTPARANQPAVMTAQERESLVAQAAYFRAEKRGFAPGGELQDWIEAEAEVLRAIGRV